MLSLAIIGGGPAGYVAAERAGARGLSVVLFEQGALGGVCLNEGCIPTKTLLYSAKTYENALHASAYGVATEGVAFDFARVVVRKNKVVRRLVAGVAAGLKAHGVEVVKGRATIVDRRDDGAFEIECDGQTYLAENLLVSTGSTAFLPSISGIEFAVTAREMLEAKELPASLVIVGGGVIGMEFASLYNSLGVRVSVVEMMPEILGTLDGEIAAMLREIYAKRGVEFHLGCRVTLMENGRIFWTDADGTEHSADTEKILVSIGRSPVVEGYGLDTLGVTLDRGGVKVDAQMRTDVPNLYAAGDVTGFSMLAHTASREGEVVVNNIVGVSDSMSYAAIPSVVYTNPEVASVGLTLAAAHSAGHTDAREVSLPMAYSGRFVAENEGANGLCKVVVGTDSRILGVHLLGGPAGEIIWGASLAIDQKMTTEQLLRTIFPHPTVSEIIKETLAR